MDDLILEDIRKLIGGFEDNTAFDRDLLIFINACVNLILPCDPQTVTAETTWSDCFGPDEKLVALAKEYVYAHTRKVFDPPSSSYVLQALENVEKEMLWRINNIISE